MAKGKPYQFKFKMYEQEVKKRLESGCIDRLAKCGAAVEREAKRIMHKGGRVEGSKKQIPSEPGQPPHAQSGDLRRSIGHAIDGQRVIVGPTEPYGKTHEFGIPPYPKRPFMEPALLNAKQKFREIFKGFKWGMNR